MCMRRTSSVSGRPQEKDQLHSVHFVCKQTTTFGAFITHLVMSLFTNYDYYTDLYQSCLQIQWLQLDSRHSIMKSVNVQFTKAKSGILYLGNLHSLGI